MHLIKEHVFGAVRGIEMGFAPVGRPLMTVFWAPGRGWLFAGDLYLGERIKFFRADEDIHAQIASLQKICALPFQALFCAHNPSPTDGPRKLTAKLEFLETLRGRVRELHARGCRRTEIIARLDPRQDRWVKWFTAGNASFANMVRSALRPERLDIF